MRLYASRSECIHTAMHMNVSRAPNAAHSKMHQAEDASECVKMRHVKNATYQECTWMHLVDWMHVNATGYENASYIGCIKMHIECTLYQMHLNATLKMRKKASKCIIPECNLHECVKMHKYAIPCSMWRMQSDGMQWKCWKCIGMH